MHLRYNLTRALSTANSNGLIIVGVLSALLFGLVALAQAWYTTEVLVESSWLLAPSMVIYPSECGSSKLFPD